MAERVTVGAPMAHVAAVLGAIGAPLVLVPSRRALVLAGLAVIALAEVVLATSGPSGISPARAALGVIGLVGLVLFAALFVRRPELVPLAILLAAPVRLPLDFGAAHRFYVGLAAGRRERPPAAAVRTDRGLRRRSRLASRACARARAGAAAPRDLAAARGARLVRGPLRPLVVGGCAGAEPPPVLPAPVHRARRRRRPLAVPGLDAACSRDRRRRPRCGLCHRRPRRGGDASGSSSTRPRSRSGTRTRASSASPRCSATRACTGATSCSRSRSCSRLPGTGSSGSRSQRS